MKRRARLAPLVVLACLSASTPAAAAEPDAHARAAQSFREGQAAYERHEYSSAAAAFDLATSFEPAAVTLLDAADAWTRAGEPVRAAEDCDRALAMPGLTRAEETYANQLLAKNRSAVATLHVDGGPTVSLTIDGGDELRAPLRRRVAPGKHVVDFRDVVTGVHVRREVDLRGGDTADMQAPVLPGAPPQAPAPPVVVHVAPSAPPDGKKVPVATWACAGVSAAAVGVAIVFGVLTVEEQSDFNATPTSASRSAFYRDRTITDVGIVTAAVGAAAALTVWLVARAPSAKSSDAGRLELGLKF